MRLLTSLFLALLVAAPALLAATLKLAPTDVRHIMKADFEQAPGVPR